MLRALTGKVHNMHEQMGNMGREILRKNQKEMLEIKKHCKRN